MINNIRSHREGETIPEALVTFLVATFSIIIIATSVITSQKIISSAEDNISTINTENLEAQEFINSDVNDNNIDESLKTYKDKISISSNGYLYSEDEVNYIKTEKTGIKAFK